MVPLVLIIILLAVISKAISDRWLLCVGPPKSTLENKVAIVTGSSRGIGKAIATRLAHAGVKVVLNGRSSYRLVSLEETLKGKGYEVASCQADITSIKECQKLIDFALRRFGRIDFLVNNAGVGSRGLLEDTSPQVFDRLLEVNVLASVYMTFLSIDHIKRTNGQIVFISSLAGIRGLPLSGPYSMTKMMFAPLAETVRRRLGGSGSASVIYVGRTRNDPGKQVLQARGHMGPISEVPGLFSDSPEMVASSVFNAIRLRRSKVVIGAKGAIYRTLLQLAPDAVEWVLRLATFIYRKINNRNARQFQERMKARSDETPIIAIQKSDDYERTTA